MQYLAGFFNKHVHPNALVLLLHFQSNFLGRYSHPCIHLTIHNSFVVSHPLAGTQVACNANFHYCQVMSEVVKEEFMVYSKFFNLFSSFF